MFADEPVRVTYEQPVCPVKCWRLSMCSAKAKPLTPRRHSAKQFWNIGPARFSVGALIFQLYSLFVAECAFLWEKIRRQTDA